jgi:hypothetical protein
VRFTPAVASHGRFNPTYDQYPNSLYTHFSYLIFLRDFLFVRPQKIRTPSPPHLAECSPLHHRWTNLCYSQNHHCTDGYQSLYLDCGLAPHSPRSSVLYSVSYSITLPCYFELYIVAYSIWLCTHYSIHFVVLLYYHNYLILSIDIDHYLQFVYKIPLTAFSTG